MSLDWLWQDFILYDYYKMKLLKRIEAFGRKNMDAEKQKLRNTLHRAVSQCHQTKYTTMSISARHFCTYHEKDEYQMVDEVRDIQRKKCLEIILKSKKGKKYEGNRKIIILNFPFITFQLTFGGIIHR